MLPEEEYANLINKYNKYSLNALKSSNNLLTILKESKKYLDGKQGYVPYVKIRLIMSFGVFR